MDEMRTFIESVLHREVLISPYKGKAKLPLSYRKGCRLYIMDIGGQESILAEPLIDTGLQALRKLHRQAEIATGFLCVLYLKELSYYARDKMIEEGIPFIWHGHQIYIPFIGALLDANNRKEIPACSRISFLTQKLLLTSLYEGWKDMTVTKAAKALDVTKVSITRCFDELEAFNIPYLKLKSRARSFSSPEDKKEMWEEIKPMLRGPVIKTYSLRKEINGDYPLGGLSALSHYSMLDDDDCVVYAIPKTDISKAGIDNAVLSPAGEEPACIIQEMGYKILFGDGKAADPLTVALSLTDEEMDDPRISKAADEMLEEYVW